MTEGTACNANGERDNSRFWKYDVMFEFWIYYCIIDKKKSVIIERDQYQIFIEIGSVTERWHGRMGDAQSSTRYKPLIWPIVNTLSAMKLVPDRLNHWLGFQ